MDSKAREGARVGKVHISRQALGRLPAYLQYLTRLQAEGGEYVTATAIAGAMRLNEIQVRKDIAAVSSRPGKPMIGFSVAELVRDLDEFLAHENVRDAVLVGVGALGRALLNYPGFAKCGMNIVAAFDVNPALAGVSVSGREVHPLEDMPRVCRRLNVMIGIIAAPMEAAQSVSEQLLAAGIVAIWNFAPTFLRVPEGILVHNEIMVSSLALLLRKAEGDAAGARQRSRTISPQTVKRLPVYLRYLKLLAEPGVSATAIAEAFGLNAVQVRKDLASVSGGGRPGIGYSTAGLIADIERSLGYDRRIPAVLMGAGNLGRAILGYTGFADSGMSMRGAFDSDPALAGARIGGIEVLPPEALPALCRREGVKLGVIAVPEHAAQAVCDQLVACGVRAIWNFAPAHLRAPSDVALQSEDLAASLTVLSKRLAERLSQGPDKQRGRGKQ